MLKLSGGAEEMRSLIKFIEESPHNLTKEDVGQIFYDHGKAWTVKENNGRLEWTRNPGLDAERER